MKEREKKVIDAQAFYSNRMLEIDYKHAEFVYRSIKPFFRGERALELGPASGYMTKRLVSDFKSLQLIEASAELASQVPAYPNVIVHHSMFENFKSSEQFDTIIMSHVLEHVEQPVELLIKVKGWLAPAGAVIVVVPNAKSIHRIVAAKMGILETIYALNERDIALGHYRVYDTASIGKDMMAAGLKITNSGGSFLKPLSNAQMEEHWTEEMIEGFYEAGKEFPDNCAEIFMIAHNSINTKFAP